MRFKLVKSNNKSWNKKVNKTIIKVLISKIIIVDPIYFPSSLLSSWKNLIPTPEFVLTPTIELYIAVTVVYIVSVPYSMIVNFSVKKGNKKKGSAIFKALNKKKIDSELKNLDIKEKNNLKLIMNLEIVIEVK